MEPITLKVGNVHKCFDADTHPVEVLRRGDEFEQSLLDARVDDLGVLVQRVQEQYGIALRFDRTDALKGVGPELEQLALVLAGPESMDVRQPEHDQRRSLAHARASQEK